jgi:hypothetical protein
MRVFVAGATGAIGRQLVPRLVEAGHEVHGMTRSESKQATTRASPISPPLSDSPLGDNLGAGRGTRGHSFEREQGPDEMMSALRPLHGESCAPGYRDGAPFLPGARSFSTGPKGSHGEPSSSGPRGQRAFVRGKR